MTTTVSSALPRLHQRYISSVQTARLKSSNLIPVAKLGVSQLYDRVHLHGLKGKYIEVIDTCRILIRDRGEPRNIAMYTALLQSLASSDDGTAGKLRRVLQDMGFWGSTGDASPAAQPPVELDAHACEVVLEVLAVHPDFLLREDLLEYMRARWFPLTDMSRNFVVAGLLRDRFFEHALETLDDMVRTNVYVQPWLFNMAIWVLLEFGEVEEAFHVLNLKEAHAKTESTRRLSEALSGALLDAAGQYQLYEQLNKIWMAQVLPGHIKPPTATCLAALMLAARHGDIALATDVFRVLTERGTHLTTHHHELLLSTYLNADDLPAALSVLLIMVDADIKVDKGTCIPLYMYLFSKGSEQKEGEQSLPVKAFALLQSMEASGRKIPTAAVNACMQASIAISRFEDALEIYKALHTVSHAGPDTQTFNVLFRGCYLNKRKGLAMFLAKEMIELHLKPDRLTYDRLILVCLQCGDLDDAVLYYEELISMGATTGKLKAHPRRKTWELLITRCVQERDARAVALYKPYKETVEDPRKDLERVIKKSFDTETGSKGRIEWSDNELTAHAAW